MKTYKPLAALMLLVTCLTTSQIFAESPDYGNTPESAFNITANDTEYFGELSTDDEDWLTFTPEAFTQYQIRISNQDANWKLFRILQEDEFGAPIEFQSYWVNNNQDTHTIYLEYDSPVYIKVEEDGGNYMVAVNEVQTVLPDSYSDTCEQANSFVVDSPALTANLDHTDSDTLDEDWFTFQTEALHVYHITISYPENSWCHFYLYNANCGTRISGSTYDYTITSWYGEDYNVLVYGDVNRFGNLYTLSINDMGPVTDDYGNTYDVATPIPTDDSIFYGTIDYNTSSQSDLDWFTFTNPGPSIYTFTFQNDDANWKNIELFQADDFGTLYSIGNWYSNNNTEIRTVYLEYPRNTYIQVKGDGGDYSLAVNLDRSFPNDTHPNTAPATLTLTPDAAPTEGSLDHSDPLNFDTDWFRFDTEPMHMYQLVRGAHEFESIYARLYNSDATQNISGNTYDYTFVSWYGDEFLIQMAGDVNRVNNYYNVQIIDLGEVPDEYGNTYDVASTIPTDGTITAGVINYNADAFSDLDWLKFESPASAYTWISFSNPDGNWKLLTLYRANEFGDPIEYYNWWTNNSVELRKFYLEQEETYFLRVSENGGDYAIIVDQQEILPLDTFGDTLEEAQPITVGSTTRGVLDHRIGADYDSDYFVFPTEPLHIYHISRTQSDAANTWFRVLNPNGTEVTNNVNDITIMSLYGDDIYVRMDGQTGTIGNYYELTIEDDGYVADDFPNTWQDAPTIAKDGTPTQGEIQYYPNYNPDVDWMKFVAGIDAQYPITFQNFDGNWKQIRVYYINDGNQPVQVGQVWAHNSTQILNLDLTANTYYIQVSDNLGTYQVSIDSPEPRCGDFDHPYPPGDANQDCYLNLEDIAIIASTWLECTSPEPPCSYLP